jgi:hypothetical protein
MIRIFLVAALIVAALALAKQERVFARAGVVHSCVAAATPAGEDGAWVVCQQGFLDGYPDLSRDACERANRTADREYWRCPEALASSYQP